MDIRNYFSSKPKAGGEKKGCGKTEAIEPDKKKHHNEDEKQHKKRKKMVLDSSDEDETDFVKQSSQPKTSQKPNNDKVEKEKVNTKLSSVSPADFFASSGKSGQVLSQGSDKSSSSSSKHFQDNKKRKADDGLSSFDLTCAETSFSPHKKPKSEKSSRDESSSSSLASKLAKKAKSDEHSESSDRHKEDKKKDDHKSPKKKSRSKSRSRSPKKKSRSKSPAAKQKTPSKTPSKTPDKTQRKSSESAADKSITEVAGTPQADYEEKKKHRQQAYQKFLTRGGAKNPGSKTVPEGSPNCFAGLVFVLTGVYESLERDEMTEIVKKLGGKATSSVSKNTSYLVVGEQAGESKLEKGRKLGTKQINEDEFLQLIRDKSNNVDSNKQGKEKENKTPPKNKEEKPYKKDKDTPKHQVKQEKVKTEVKSPPEKKSGSVEMPKIPKIPKIKTEEIKKEAPMASVSKVSNSDGGEGSGETQLWVDKYKPVNLKGIIGQQGDRSCMNKLKIWLRDWNDHHLHRTGKGPAKPAPWATANDNGAWAKAALLSGPPGVGKTTTAYLVAKELGFDVVEFNASDTRSKKLLEQSVTNILSSTSVSSLLHQDNKVTAKRVLLMDEVDGMAGNEDRGGVAELIALLKTSKVPVICMCNDRNHQKIRSLANHCFDLRFQRPRPEQIKAAMMSICFKEKIKIKPEALNEIIVGCGQDVRQVLHHLSMIKAGETGVKMEAAEAKKEAEKSKKTSIKLGPWDVCKKVFTADDHKTMSLMDKSDLYFYDYNLAGLFVQENYLSSTPQASRGNRKKTMELVSKAADSLAIGDTVERGIRSGMNWSLLPTAAIFCSVLPGEYMSGHLHGQIQFPSWLGKNSRRNKMDRILQELQQHTRLSAGAGKQAFNLDYAQHLRDHVVRPLVKEGSEGVDEAVASMETYALLREDLDGLLEVTQWPDNPDPFKHVDSKTKAAFTRKYNKDAVLLPYSTVQTVKKKAKEPVAEGFDEEELEDEDEEEDSVENDAMIKVKKPSKAQNKDETKGKGKGAGKGASGSGKGKGKAK